MDKSLVIELVVVFIATTVAALVLNRPILVFFVSLIATYLYFVVSMGGLKESAPSGFAVGWALLPTLLAFPVCMAASACGWLARKML
jgi:hypothetical protein